MAVASGNLVFKQFVLIRFTRMPQEFADKVALRFCGRWHRYSNRDFGEDWIGCGIICDAVNVRGLYEYARDCGLQLDTSHFLVQLEYVDALFSVMRSMRSRLDVRPKGEPQRFHVVFEVQ